MPRSTITGGTIARSILAIVAGYVIFVFGATIAQETILGGVSYGESSLLILGAAGLLTPLSAAIGGAFTAVVAPYRPLLHLLPMSVLIAVETCALYITGRTNGPAWFELGAGLALIGGAYTGGFFSVQLRSKQTRSKSVSSEAQ